jgi:hypothetical protein
VNKLKEFGRWDFHEFSDVYAIENEFARLVDGLQESAREREVV